VKPTVHVQRTFRKDEETKKCLDELLGQAAVDFERENPEAVALTWYVLLFVTLD